MPVWLRRCSSFAEEARADHEFWATMTAEQRVAAVDDLLMDWLRAKGLPDERLRKSVRVLDRPQR